jgi:hypothetical protein
MGRGDGIRQRRILELNAGHALVQGLRRRFDANPSDPVVGDYAELLLGWSLLAEGSEPHDPVRFTQLVAGLMETGLGAAPAAPAAPETPSEAPAAEASAAESASDEAASEEGPADASSAAEPGEASPAPSQAATEEAASAD